MARRSGLADSVLEPSHSRSGRRQRSGNERTERRNSVTCRTRFPFRRVRPDSLSPCRPAAALVGRVHRERQSNGGSDVRARAVTASRLADRLRHETARAWQDRRLHRAVRGTCRPRITLLQERRVDRDSDGHRRVQVGTSETPRAIGPFAAGTRRTREISW